MGKRVVTNVAEFKRISLHLTVPGRLSDEAWNHLLASVERFEQSKNVSLLDLDMKSVPMRSTHQVLE